MYNLFAGGDGTENDPYLIMYAQQLKDIPLLDSDTTYFKLGDNIDLLGENWEALPEFQGHLDGDGYTITGFYTEQSYIFSNTGGIGLFEANSGTIENVHVRGRIAQTQNVRAGLIAGINNGLIKNSSSGADTRRDMIFLFKHTSSYAGGITGYNGIDGTVQGCINYGSMQGMDHAGGLVGYNEGTITECYNACTLIEGTSNTGGIVGYNEGGTVEKSYNISTVWSSENVGGIAGYNAGTVEKSYNTGDVIGNFLIPQNIGGIVGYNAGGEVYRSYNTGSVGGGEKAGGVVGVNAYGYVAYNYNAGDVSGDNCIGGIVGWYIFYTGAVVSNISLGSSMTAVTFAGACRVFCGTGFFVSNKARDDMTVTTGGIPRTSFSNTYGNDGEDTAIGTALSDVFFNWDSSVWSIPGGSLTINGALPTLLGMPAGVQAPLLAP